MFKFLKMCVPMCDAILLRARRAKLIIAYTEKYKPCHVCMYVTLYSSGVLRQISDFLVLKIRQKICGATRTKIISFT